MATRGEKQKEDWMNSKWRPAMGWMYMLTCVTDFVLFPILWSLLQTLLKQPVTQWSPLTLQGAGLFHLAMGAVLGVAAYGRTQEKLSGANNGGIPMPSTGFSPGLTTTSTPSTGFGAAPGGFGPHAPSTSFTPAPSWGTTPVSTAPTQTFGAGPPPAQKPEL
jgi:hypothetical protein